MVHADCRKRFTDKRKSVDSQPTNSKRLRTKFMWKTLFFFCEKTINKDYKSSKEFSRVMTLEVKERVLKRASERDDEWVKTVESRLLSSNDLVAEEAIYHKACVSKFCLSKTGVYKKSGRPVNTEMFNGFEAICAWLEEDDDCNLHTINELQEQIKLMGYKCYSNKLLKQKLKEKYGDCLTFSESCGRTDILCFKEFANYVLQEKKKEEVEETKERIVKAAVKIIKSEIREVEKSKEYYPTNLEVQDLKTCLEWIPESLMILLKIIMPNILKQTAIAHSIIQVARPRSVLYPIPFGFGVQLDKESDSKWLISHLHKLGFSISPDEMQKYKQSPVVSDGKETTQEFEQANEIEEAGPSEVNTTGELDVTNDKAFALWSAGNVDHNIVTLTRKGTFYGMSMISMSDDCSQY